VESKAIFWAWIVPSPCPYSHPLRMGNFHINPQKKFGKFGKVSRPFIQMGCHQNNMRCCTRYLGIPINLAKTIDKFIKWGLGGTL